MNQPPIPQLTPWKILTDWFKTFQKRNNDILFTPLAILLFIKVPEWYNDWAGGKIFHPFSIDTLNALPFALVCFCFANLGAYFMFRFNHNDLFDEWTRCNEQDLLKKVVSSDTAITTASTITPSQSRHAWRIHHASQSILFHYFWALVVLQAVIASSIPTTGH